MNMHFTVLIVVLAWLLSSCSANEDSRYRDTSQLELPPALLDTQPAKADTSGDGALADPKESKGLGDDVYLSAAKPIILKIKQPLDIAWNTVASALRQADVEIKDRELDKGQYYVIFDPDQYVADSDSVLDRFGSLFVNEYGQSIYILTLTADGDETLITADKAQASEQSAADDSEDREADAKPEDDEKPDGAEKLLLFLHNILHDELVDK